MSVPPESRPPLRPSTSPLRGLSDVRPLTRTASGKDGGRNTKTEVTTRVWHEELQKLRLFYAAIDEDEGDN